MYGKNLFFLEDKKDVAAQGFLDNVKRRIISYHELKQITRVFDTNLSKKEKDVFLGKNRAKKTSKNKRSKRSSLIEDDGSLAFFHIRVYCRNQRLTISWLSVKSAVRLENSSRASCISSVISLKS